jgi:citrate lyase subunit beta/citryl-CoA lyase
MTMTRKRPYRRSWLSVPAIQPKGYERLAKYDADVFGLDLEDSIAPARKNEARATLVELAKSTEFFHQREFFVRINDVNSPYFQDDMAALARLGSYLDGVVVPKVNGAKDIASVDAALRASSLEIVPLIETLAGEAHLASILTASKRIRTVQFAENADYSAELAIALEPLDAVTHPIGRDFAVRVVKQARLNGIDVMAGPYLDLKDESGLEQQCQWARQLGISGKVAIHPKQLETINRIFSPDPQEIAAAEAIIAAYEARDPKQAIVPHGDAFILPPHYKLAKRFLKRFAD